MFLLHERTRKTLCRLGFVALCAAPTLCAALWAASRTSDEHRNECAAELGRSLRMAATIERVTYPRPGSTRYEDLRLSDSETSAPVAAIASLEVRDDGDTTTLFASGAAVHGEQLSQIWDAVSDRLRATGAERKLRLVATDLEVITPGGAFSLEDVRAGIDQSTSGNAGWLSFRAAGSAADSKPIVARVVRRRGEGEAQTGFELSTNENALPLALALAMMGEAQNSDHLFSLSTGRFYGTIKAVRDTDGWRGEIDGRIADLDFGHELGERFPHRLMAIGEITLAPAVFRGGRLEHARGRITAGPGEMGESLVSAAATALGLQRVGRISNQSDVVEFDQMAFDFVADASALVIKGRCSDTHPAALLANQGQPLLLEANGPSGPPVQLIQALAPANALMVPAGRETETLLRILPAPPVVRR